MAPRHVGSTWDFLASIGSLFHNFFTMLFSDFDQKPLIRALSCVPYHWKPPRSGTPTLFGNPYIQYKSQTEEAPERAKRLWPISRLCLIFYKFFPLLNLQYKSMEIYLRDQRWWFWSVFALSTYQKCMGKKEAWLSRWQQNNKPLIIVPGQSRSLSTKLSTSHFIDTISLATTPSPFPTTPQPQGTVGRSTVSVATESAIQYGI